MARHMIAENTDGWTDFNITPQFTDKTLMWSLYNFFQFISRKLDIFFANLFLHFCLH